MTEQERRRHRREMERRMRTRADMQRKKTKKGGMTSFRIYVTAILVGGCFLVSLFHTETSEAFCGKVRMILAEQISAEEIAAWREQAAAYWKEKELVFPVFEERGEKEKNYYPDTEP